MNKTELIAEVAKKCAMSTKDAYQIGTKIKQGVEKLGHDVVDSISLGDEQLFYYAMQSIRPINLS